MELDRAQTVCSLDCRLCAVQTADCVQLAQRTAVCALHTAAPAIRAGRGRNVGRVRESASERPRRLGRVCRQSESARGAPKSGSAGGAWGLCLGRPLDTPRTDTSAGLWRAMGPGPLAAQCAHVELRRRQLGLGPARIGASGRGSVASDWPRVEMPLASSSGRKQQEKKNGGGARVEMGDFCSIMNSNWTIKRARLFFARN